MTAPATLAPDALDARLAAEALEVLGGFHPGPADGAPPGTRTLLMVGPRAPGFWEHVTRQPEFADGRPDPLDRWSRRTLGRIACDLGGKALFPFGGPPWHPFHAWALRTGRCHASPVGLLVHDRQGLWVSFRGALAFGARLPVPPPSPSPCASCAERPCLTACPAGALTGAGYDVPACHAFLDTGAGRSCLTQGCRVRAACPESRGHPRPDAQQQHHMRHFHRWA
jgi:hypothetical protein